MEHPSSPPELFVVRDEMWELVQNDPALQAVEVVKAEAVRRGLTTDEFLDELVRQGRRQVVPVPVRIPFTPQGLSGLD
ncbi:hypothetical protein ACFXEL_35020 [Streptomyces sp. NPDC059382]|uniref:hypothetical protein n=1 Tax=Streptomyces sp. NPDC059382 TaxID=3346816 RepID=UPI0036860CC1